ncbi:MAG: DUF4915 domain-containing protein [Chloroflexi bacterium]|nr:MAG: DUF4915 domain-containing protein [Chloroflexota bacterium]
MNRRVRTLWSRHHAALRDPHRIIVQGPWDVDTDARLLQHHVRGDFWGAVEAAGGRLLISREYEHLLVALVVMRGRPRVSYMRLPHPSGMAVDPEGQRLHVASTRNPNMLFDLAPCRRFLKRRGAAAPRELETALLPVRCRYLPGALYIHDLARIGRRLFANAVASNAVIEIDEKGGFQPVWWPKSIDGKGGPRLDRNYLQLNSIAAGKTLADSFFTASVKAPVARRPGDPRFPVDGQGVVFSGRTRRAVVQGLTRPHSARLMRGRLFVANSGYGQVVEIRGGRSEEVARLPGWTRGLCGDGRLAFVGTSRVVPRFRRYAPGLDPRRCECGVHAVDLRTGRIVGSLLWPEGNQVFAAELAHGLDTIGFPFTARPSARRVERFFFLGL